MFPRLIDGGFHTVGQDDELGRPAVVMAAKTYNVNLSHGGRKITKKLRGEHEVGFGLALGQLPELRSFTVSSPWGQWLE
jgi:hypothetical protein